MRGRSQAVLVVAVTALLAYLLPPLSLLSIAAISLVVLRNGATAGLQVTAGALLATALLGQLTLGTPLVAISYLGLMWMPAMALALVLRRTRSLAATFETAAMLAVAVVVALHAMLGDPALWWGELLETAAELFLASSPELAGGDAARMAAAMAPMMTELMVAAGMLNLLFGLLWARTWQSRLYNPGGFRREFHAMRLHRGPAVIAALLLVGALASETGGMLSDMGMTLLVLFGAAGLAVAHAWVARRGLHVAWLVVMYVVLLIAAEDALVALGAFGFANVWFDLARSGGGPKTA